MYKLKKILRMGMIYKKRLFLILTIILFIGIALGSIFVTLLHDSDKGKVIEQVRSFFNTIEINKVSHFQVLQSSFISNVIYIGVIWILGISIIGMPIILMMIGLKGFIIGFSLGSIILNYKIKGILAALGYLFPHVVILILLMLIVAYYALYLSYNLFLSVIRKQSMHFKGFIGYYHFLLLISIFIISIAAFIESYISPYLIRFVLRIM